MRWVSCNIPIVHRVLGHSSGHICSLVLCVVVGLPSFILERPPPPSPDMGGIGEIKYTGKTKTNKWWTGEMDRLGSAAVAKATSIEENTLITNQKTRSMKWTTRR